MPNSLSGGACGGGTGMFDVGGGSFLPPAPPPENKLGLALKRTVNFTVEY